MAPRLLTMYAVFTAGIATLSGGCVIPVPLEPSAGSNAPPLIVKDALDPAFARTVTFSDTTPREFHVEARDLDIDDQLFAVLARETSLDGSLTGLIDIALLPAGGDDPSLRTGNFPPVSCNSLSVGAAGDFIVRLVVSDREFAAPILTLRTDGSTDEAFWVVRCQ